MEIILNHNKYNAIWDKIDNDFQFYPSCGSYPEQWLSLPMKSRKYRLNEVFTEEQENIINSIFCRVNPRDMYALDWHHDCFIYNPCEEIPSDYWFYDAERNCNVFSQAIIQTAIIIFLHHLIGQSVCTDIRGKRKLLWWESS